MTKKSRLGALSLGLAWCVAAFAVEGAELYRDPTAPIERRVDDLLGRLSLDEKISLMSGATMFGTQGIERLGIPSLRFADGPNGVRSNHGDDATAFPTGVGMAATWNPALVQEVGAAIGREARALNIQVMLAPDVNIQRAPLAGRNFEDYSEDPFLTGRIGTSFVKGVQSEGVGVSVKHFVGNEQEVDRSRSSSNIDERTLREIYLRPFEMIVKEAQPWTVMASYNRLNGVHMSENRRLLTDVLKREWGFDGLVMSDWFGLQSTAESARAGLDLEMPGPPRYFGSFLERAVQNYLVPESDIDAAARRMLRLIMRTGLLDGKPLPYGEISTEAHRKLARRVAEESITLLKNDKQLLPLDRKKIKTLAVIGPNADAAIIQGGGSSHVLPSEMVTPLEALRALLGSSIHVDYAQGVDNEPAVPAIDARRLSPTQARKERGLAFSYYANAHFAGKPIQSGIDRNFDKFGFGEGLAPLNKQFSARWEGWLWPAADGVYEFALSQSGTATLFIDGKPLISPATPVEAPGGGDFASIPNRSVRIPLKAGRGYAVKLDYTSNFGGQNVLKLGVRPPVGTMDEAVKRARAADAAIVFVGGSSGAESEGQDRENLELYGKQNELVEAVLAANPNTVVVLNNGGPLSLPWIDKAPTVLEAWLPGQEGSYAVADVLFGRVNPSGKLPLSFPKRLADNPTYLYYSGGRDANYGEGVFVGYRYYDKKLVEPLFPFGYGLSYTHFDYSNLHVPSVVRPGEPITVSVEVRNSGERVGAETVQLYVGDRASHDEVVRPVKELKAFEKIELQAGEKRTLHFELTPRDLAYYDTGRRAWRAPESQYRVYVGGSSRNIRVSGDFKFAETAYTRD